MDTQTRFWVDGEWNRPYIYLCSRCKLRYMLTYTHAWTTTWGAQNVRCTIMYTNVIRCTNKQVPRFLIFEALNWKTPNKVNQTSWTLYCNLFYIIYLHCALNYCYSRHTENNIHWGLPCFHWKILQQIETLSNAWSVISISGKEVFTNFICLLFSILYLPVLLYVFFAIFVLVTYHVLCWNQWDSCILIVFLIFLSWVTEGSILIFSN